jgi:hypothetical protein
MFRERSYQVGNMNVTIFVNDRGKLNSCVNGSMLFFVLKLKNKLKGHSIYIAYNKDSLTLEV